MKLIFSEAKSDYANYIFPYAIWAFPEPGEKPGMILNKGFLPASRNLNRYYMCRHIRIHLSQFQPSSENRRILRKGEGIEFELLKRKDFKYTKGWRNFCKDYADIKFGKDIMTYERLDSLFESPIISHIMLYKDSKTHEDIGIVTLYLEDDLSFYYYSFYNLNYYKRNLGMFMMTSCVDYFAENKFQYIYLGSCYSKNALYKTQFSGAHFFNGFIWSDNLKELKYLIKHDNSLVEKHLAETEEFLEFYDGSLEKIVSLSEYWIKI